MSEKINPDPKISELIRSMYFDGFPYLVTYLVPALYHIILLPSYV